MEINGRRAFKLPDKNVVCFYYQPMKNNIASQQQGKAVYDKVLMAEIHSPGMKNQIHRPAVTVYFNDGRMVDYDSGHREGDSNREIPWREWFGESIRQFESGEATPESGTPLETWPKIDVALAASLRDSGIFTVEMIADLADSRLHVLPMGAGVLRDQAKAFLETARGNSQNDKLIAEKAALQAQFDRMQKTIDDLTARLPTVENDVTEPRRGPGRPPKAA